MLTRSEAKEFYDAFGSRQDNQAWYEDPPLQALRESCRFDDARAIFEFGCGTGRFARQLFDDLLPADATYLGTDLSATMVGLAQERLTPYSVRAKVRLSDGSSTTGEAAESFDRFISSYVLDLLPEADIEAVLQEAWRILKPNGILGLVGLTHGVTSVPRLISRLWSFVHRINPRRVGGCRPIVAADSLDSRSWNVLHRRTICCRGLTSEILVAVKVSEGSK